MIPYGRQNVNDDDIVAVIDVLRSDFLTQGSMVPEFERRIAGYCQAAHAVAVNSATSALHLACLALGVRPGDRVWTSPITFVASANCAVYCGATVDFVDIDPRTFNMSADALEEKLFAADRSGHLPKVVIPVHMCGQACDIERIHRLAVRFGFRIIEDASHAIGAKYKDEPVGNCRYSDITVFSFHPVKIITTGEGGMALTNDAMLAHTMQRLRNHGVTRNPAEMVGQSEGPWFYQQVDLGFNYRLTDIQAALGISQLSRLDGFVAERHALANEYDRLLDGSIGTAPWRSPDAYSSFHLYVMQLNLEAGATQREMFERLRVHGVMVNLHYIPVYRHPYYRKAGHAETTLPRAEAYYARAITLPLYPGLRRDQQQEIVDMMKSALGRPQLS